MGGKASHITHHRMDPQRGRKNQSARLLLGDGSGNDIDITDEDDANPKMSADPIPPELPEGVSSSAKITHRRSRPCTATAPTTLARSHSTRRIQQSSHQGKDENQELRTPPLEPSRTEIAHEQILASTMISEDIQMDYADLEQTPGAHGPRAHKGSPIADSEPVFK